MRIVSTYAGHESSISFYDNGKITVVELDKLTNTKYFSFHYLSTVEKSELLDQAMEIAGVENDFDMWINGSYHSRRNGVLEYKKLENIINTKRMVFGPGHHTCHAHSAFWQSPFDKAWLVSSDGGGNDGYFNIYHCDRVHGPQPDEQIDRFDFGTTYGLIGATLPQVGRSTKWFFDVAGKAMALAGQLDGAPAEHLKTICHQIYSGSKGGWTELGKVTGLSYHPNKPDTNNENIKRANWDFQNSNHKHKTHIHFKDQRLGLKLAKANQVVLQEKFEAILTDRQYNIGLHDDNIIITGGVALNINNNENIKNTFNVNTFVPPNPTDGGLSLGGLFWYMHLVGLPVPDQDYKFSGTPLIENKKFKKKRKSSIKALAKMIKDGAILGIVEGQSELGPRALGHRSIICDPSNKDVVEKLNKDIKHREWYRPFAPIMLEDQLEHVETHSTDDLTKMSYATKVSLDFERKYPAVVHVDGTARVQICEDKDSTVYKLLQEIGTPLLNTSFNDNGYPIVASTEDAYMMLPSLDGIVINGVLIKE